MNGYFFTATHSIALAKRSFKVSYLLTQDLLKKFYGKPNKLLKSKHQSLMTGTINSIAYTTI